MSAHPICCGARVKVLPAYCGLIAVCSECLDYDSIQGQGETEQEALDDYAQRYEDTHGEDCPRSLDLSAFIAPQDPSELDPEHQREPLPGTRDDWDEDTLPSVQDFFEPPERVVIGNDGRVKLDRNVSLFRRAQ